MRSRVRGQDWLLSHAELPLVRVHLKGHSHTKLTPWGPESTSDRSPVHLHWMCIFIINDQFQSSASEPSTSTYHLIKSPVHSTSYLLIYDIYIIVFGFWEAEQAHKEGWDEFTLLKFYMIAHGHLNKDVSFISRTNKQEIRTVMRLACWDKNERAAAG